MLDAPDAFASYDARRAAQAAQTLWVDDESWCEGEMPQRPWVAHGYALRGSVTMLVGPPSAMKSSVMLAWAASIALKADFGDFRPVAAGAVIVYDVEDDRTEQRRRLSAVLRQFDAVPGDIAGKIIRVGPAGVGTLFSLDSATGRITPTAAMDRLRDLIREREASMLIADPLAELHTAEENDNSALRSVIAEFRALAVEFDLAVVLVHHTRKGAVAPGDPDAARGASAIIGAARVVLTLCGMTEDEAAALGMATDRKTRSRFVRLDDAKQNYSGIGDGRWLQKVLYSLDNGEVVPAAVPWVAPDMWTAIPPVVANRILDEIDAGIDGGKQRYSPTPNATTRGAWNVVIRHVASITEQQARAVIKTWIKNGVLRVEDYDDTVEGKKFKGAFVNPAKRPGASST